MNVSIMSKQTKKGKFKSIFGRKSSGIDIDSVEEKDAQELFFTREVLTDISCETSLANRVRNLRELGEVCGSIQKERNWVQKFIWQNEG